MKKADALTTILPRRPVKTVCPKNSLHTPLKTTSVSTSCPPPAYQSSLPPNRRRHNISAKTRGLRAATTVGPKPAEPACPPEHTAKADATIKTKVTIRTAIGDDIVWLTGPSAKVKALTDVLQAKAPAVAPGDATATLGLWAYVQAVCSHVQGWFA